MVMIATPNTKKPRSWRDCLMGIGARVGVQVEAIRNLHEEKELELSKAYIVG